MAPSKWKRQSMLLGPGLIGSWLILGLGCSQESTQEVTAPDRVSEITQFNCQLPQHAPEPTAPSTAFGHFAWKQFVALNWPAGEQRGQPDCDRRPGDSGPTVWERYKTTDQLFLSDAKDPGPWDNGSNEEMILKHRAKASEALPVESSIRQAVGGWLIDQQRNPTYYSISINEDFYEYVRRHQYYNADIVGDTDSLTFPEGALEVKAAWRIMTEKDHQDRFHTIEARVTRYDAEGNPTGETPKKTVGLVGMHIVYKAPGFPQWVWATFEQVDNTDPSATGHASYYNPDCEGEYCEPNQSPLESGQSFDEPNQLTRINPVSSDIAKVNRAWQDQVAGTVFEHYRLVSPQWPSDPKNPGNPQGSPTPDTVANVTMESYIQPTSSCMDCHSTARVPGDGAKSDYSFIFLFAQSPGSDTAQAVQGESQ